MTAREIYDFLLSRANSRWQETCDGWIAGDENRQAKRAATCFKLSAQVLSQAIAENVDVIITHEPVFSQGERREDAVLPADQMKWHMLDESGIVVYRFHDHAHDSTPDYIHDGFIRAVDLKIAYQYPNESLGICRYELQQETTVAKLTACIKERLGLEGLRIVGAKDGPVRTLCLALGGVGLQQVYYLMDPGCDVFITGETGEVLTCEYVRDACFFGAQKTLLLLGHCSAEWAGMRLLAEQLNEQLVPTCYLHCGEVFSFV